MSIDSRYTWDSARMGAGRYQGSRRRKFGFWVLLAVSAAVVIHAVGLWALGRFNLLLELADFEWTSQTFQVGKIEELPEEVVAPVAENEKIEPPKDAEDLLTEIEELIPELDDTEIDIVPDLEKPKVALEPLKPAKIGEENGQLLEPLQAPEVQANLAELGRNEPIFTEVPEGRVIIEEGSISADIPDPDSFLKDAAVRGANGLEENGLMKGYTELGRYLNFDVDQLDKGRAALPSDLLFEFNRAELRQNARLGLMKLGMLIDRNPEMYCILEGHSDLFGTDSYNLELSRKRAQAVKNWLVSSLGLDSTHIIVRACGRSKPKVQEGDQDQQAINRRVDILMRKQIPPEEVVPVRVTPRVRPPVAVPPKALPVPEEPPAPPPAPAQPVPEEPPPRAIPVEEEIPPRAVPIPERIPPPQPVEQIRDAP
ncbi:MAG: OmpA family protein [Verrucomicrobiota bacterium]|nr:OmpA family protein [Verrucomicrobiota bacterium]